MVDSTYVPVYHHETTIPQHVQLFLSPFCDVLPIIMPYAGKMSLLLRVRGEIIHIISDPIVAGMDIRGAYIRVPGIKDSSSMDAVMMAARLWSATVVIVDDIAEIFFGYYRPDIEQQMSHRLLAINIMKTPDRQTLYAWNGQPYIDALWSDTDGRFIARAIIGRYDIWMSSFDNGVLNQMDLIGTSAVTGLTELMQRPYVLGSDIATFAIITTY